MRHPLTLRFVIFEKARTVLPLSLPLLRISLMRRIGVSAVPEISEPSKRISPLLTVLVSVFATISLGGLRSVTAFGPYSVRSGELVHALS